MPIVKLAVMPEKLVVKLVAPTEMLAERLVASTEMLAERLVAPTEMLVERLVVSPGMHSEILLDKHLVVLGALQRPLCVRFSPDLQSLIPSLRGVSKCLEMHIW